MKEILIIALPDRTSPEFDQLKEAFSPSTNVSVGFWNDLLYYYNGEKEHTLFLSQEERLKNIREFNTIFLRAYIPLEPDIRNILIRESQRSGITLVGTVPDPNTAIENKADTMHFCNTTLDMLFPQTFFANHRVILRHFDYIAETLGYPFVCKPNSLRKGEGVTKINSKEEFIAYRETLLASVGKKKASYFLCQKFIENNGDYRVLVIGNKTYTMKRTAQTEGEFRHNFSLGGTVAPATIPEDIEEQSIRATSAMRQDFSGVDYIENNGQFICLEVNKAPGLSGISRAHPDTNLFKQVATYIENK